jgi:hypothetical protein
MDGYIKHRKISTKRQASLEETNPPPGRKE